VTERFLLCRWKKLFVLGQEKRAEKHFNLLFNDQKETY
jgi:hypothetical protein